MVPTLAGRKQTARKTLRQRNLEHAKEIQGEHENDHAQCENEIRIGELKSSPSDVAPSGLERNQEQSKRDEPGKNANRKRDSAPQNFLPALARLLNESKDFQRNQGQDARHEVEKKATDKTEEQKSENSAYGRWTNRRNNRRSCSYSPRRAIFGVWLLRKNDKARDGRQLFLRRLYRNAKDKFVAV